MAWGDADCDGDLDLFVANRLSRNALYLNDGQAGFKVYRKNMADPRYFSSHGVAWLDADNDGDLDLFVATKDRQNRLFANTLGCDANTIIVRPLTPAGAPSLFGSVRLMDDRGHVLAVRTLDGGGSYASQNGYGAHFAGSLLPGPATYVIGVESPSERWNVTWSVSSEGGGGYVELRSCRSQQGRADAQCACHQRIRCSAHALVSQW